MYNKFCFFFYDRLLSESFNDIKHINELGKRKRNDFLVETNEVIRLRIYQERPMSPFIIWQFWMVSHFNMS